MTNGRRDALQGRWIHSHEEDTDDEMVFRPADHPFPPSRGRMALELRPDGTYVETSPGPVDVPESHTGAWSLDGDVLRLAGEGEGISQEWRVAEVHPDRLIVRR